MKQAVQRMTTEKTYFSPVTAMGLTFERSRQIWCDPPHRTRLIEEQLAHRRQCKPGDVNKKQCNPPAIQRQAKVLDSSKQLDASYARHPPNPNNAPDLSIRKTILCLQASTVSDSHP